MMSTLAHIAPMDQRCGIADYALLLSEALRAHWRVIPVALSESLEAKAWRASAALANTADIALVQYEYSLLQTVKPFRNQYARLLKRLDLPVIVTLHDRLPELTPRLGQKDSYGPRDLLRDLAYLPFFRSWSTNLYTLAAHHITHAPGVAEAIRRLDRHVDLTFLHHPMPPMTISWTSDQPRTHTFATPGFIKPHKGYCTFLQLLAKIPAWTWLIAGGPQDSNDRDFLKTFEDQIKALGLTDRVTITGYLDRQRLEAALLKTELAVFPYQRATASGAAAWAIGLGMPVAATDLDCFSAMAADGAGILLLPASAPERWLPLLSQPLAAPAALDSLAKSNREFRQEMSYRKVGERITAIARDLVVKPPAQGPGRP